MAKRKTKLKTLAVSSLIALATIGVGAGGTFALFTDVDEARVTVQAGTVDIESNIAIKAAASLNAEDATTVAENKLSASFVNGGSATVDNELGTVALAKWTPGDTVTLETTPTNNSNVKINVRLKVVMTGELASALVVEGLRNDTRELAMTGERTVVSGWVEVSPNEDIDAYDVKISFPDHDGGEALYGTANKDNQYQGKEAQIQIFYEAVQANAKLDATLEGINSKLATEEIVDGEKNHTMYDALLDLTEAQVTAIRESDYVWSQELDEFFDFASAPEDAYKYFKMYESMTAATEGYSIYADNATWDSAVALDRLGFDAGDATGITTINYTNTTGAARDVVIRSNSSDTTLTINAETDTVTHYGQANVVDITAVAGNSYHEFGVVNVAKIAKGRIVVAEEAELDQIKAVATNDEFNDIKVAIVGNAKIPTLSRDRISLDDITEEGTHSKLVLELQKLENHVDTPVEKNTEYVWASIIVDGQGNATSSTEVAKSKTELSDDTRIADPDVDYVPYITKVSNYTEFADALAEKRPYIVFTNDISYATNGTGLLNINYDVIIDGDGHSLSGYGSRSGKATTIAINGINPSTDDINVEFKNLTIYNDGTAGRPIESRGKLASLKLYNTVVNAAGSSGYTQGITLGGNQTNKAKLIIEKSTITSKKYYAIIAFNPFDAMVTDSTFNGWCSLYFKAPDGSAGSAGSTAVLKNCTLNNPNNYNGVSNAFGSIVVEDSDITVSLEDCKVYNTQNGDQRQSVLVVGNNGINFIIKGNTYIDGKESICRSTKSGITTNIEITSGTYNFDPTTYVDQEVYNVIDNEDGTWTVTAK